jgi:peptidoglycan DL-endopeptidase CwlO
MSTSGIGSTPSFWQQDQSYWSQQQSASNSQAATTSVIEAMSSAEASLGKGLASIANKTALNRVNSQLSAAIQNVLDGGVSSSSSSTSAGSSASTGSTTSSAAPATAVGTAPLTISTQLSSLGIRAGGTITVSAGGNTTTYASTGSDTVGDLMVALNKNLYGSAAVTASLNTQGDLVIASKNATNTVTIGGVYASNIGFSPANRTFKPTGTPASTAVATPSPAPATTSSSSSSSATVKKSYTTTASLMLNTASSLLSDSGAGGSLVDMLS